MFETGSIQWAGEEWKLAGDVLTGEWYRYLRSVHLPLMRARDGAGELETEKNLDAIKGAAVFCSRYLLFAGSKVSPKALIELSGQRRARVWPELCGEIIARSGWGDVEGPILSYYRLVFSAEHYNPTKAALCPCSECEGEEEFDPECLFRRDGFSSAGNLVASLSPELVREYWDHPLYLFNHARAERQALAESSAARRQAREEEERARRRRGAEDVRLDAALSHIPRF